MLASYTRQKGKFRSGLALHQLKYNGTSAGLASADLTHQSWRPLLDLPAVTGRTFCSHLGGVLRFKETSSESLLDSSETHFWFWKGISDTSRKSSEESQNTSWMQPEGNSTQESL